MKNAALIAMEFDAMLPPWERPEHTSDYEGFYHLLDIKGDCSDCEMSYLIREHDREKYEERKETVKRAAAMINARYGNGTAEVEIRDGYRNMAEMVRPHMHLIDFAKEAIAECGVEPRVPAIRGGTDGAELSFKRRAVSKPGNRILQSSFSDGNGQYRSHGKVLRSDSANHR